MDGGRDAHQAAIGATLVTIGELQDHLAVATDKAEVAAGFMSSVVGTTVQESGVNAMRALNEAAHMIAEAFRLTQISQDELRRFREGF